MNESNSVLVYLTCVTKLRTTTPSATPSATTPSPRPRATRAWPDVRVAATASDVLGSRSARFRSAHLTAPGRSPGFCKSVDVRVPSRGRLWRPRSMVSHVRHTFSEPSTPTRARIRREPSASRVTSTPGGCRARNWSRRTSKPSPSTRSTRSFYPGVDRDPRSY